MVRKLGNLVKVVNYARHQLAGLYVVKVGKRQLMHMLEQVAAHVVLYAHAHYMAPVFHNALHCVLNEVQRGQQQAPLEHRPEVARRQQRVHYHVDRVRENQLQKRQRNRARKVDYEQLHVRLVVWYESLNHTYLHPNVLYTYSSTCAEICICGGGA